MPRLTDSVFDVAGGLSGGLKMVFHDFVGRNSDLTAGAIAATSVFLLAAAYRHLADFVAKRLPILQAMEIM